MKQDSPEKCVFSGLYGYFSVTITICESKCYGTESRYCDLGGELHPLRVLLDSGEDQCKALDR